MKTHSPIARLTTALLVSAALMASQTALAKDAFGNSIVSATDRAQVSVGMTQAQVLTALGKPASTETYTLSQQTSWMYGAADTTIYRDAIYYVTFGRDGKVASAGVVDPGTN